MQHESQIDVKLVEKRYSDKCTCQQPLPCQGLALLLKELDRLAQLAATTVVWGAQISMRTSMVI